MRKLKSFFKNPYKLPLLVGFFLLSLLPLPQEKSIDRFIESFFLKVSFSLVKSRADTEKYLIIRCPRIPIPYRADSFSFIGKLITELEKLDPAIILFDTLLPVPKSSDTYAWLTYKKMKDKFILIYPEHPQTLSVPFEPEPDYGLANASFVINQRENLEVLNFVDMSRIEPAGYKAAKALKGEVEPKSPQIKYYFDEDSISQITLKELLEKHLPQGSLSGKVILIRTGAFSVFDKPFLTPVGIMSPEALLFNDIETRLKGEKTEAIPGWVYRTVLLGVFALILILFRKLWLLKAIFWALLLLEFLLLSAGVAYFSYGMTFPYFQAGLLASLFIAVNGVLQMHKLKKGVLALKELETLKTILVLQNKSLLSMKKLSDLGRLSSGIYHEISNPLHNIHNALKLVYSAPGLDVENRDLIEIAVKEIVRLEKLSLNLKQFYQPASCNHKEVNIHEVLDFSLKLLNSTFSAKRISLTRNYSDQVPLYLGDWDKLQQVFLNLLLNAIDAVDIGGKIQVITRINEKEITVSISDSGHGIPDSIRADIFKAFFTTKGEKGSGLGLYVSYEIVNAMDGDIDIAPFEEGKGAEFTLRFRK